MSRRDVTVIDQGTWTSLSSPPHPALRPFLTAYNGYEQDAAPGAMRTLPQTFAVVIINLGEPLHLAHMPSPSFGGGLFGSFAAGMHDGPGLYEHSGRQRGVQLDLTPLGAYTLLGLPMSEIANVVVELSDLLGPQAGLLVERLAATPSWAGRFDLLDRVLSARLAEGPEPAPEVAQAWRMLAGSGGLVPVGAVAAEVGWSRKHLLSRFREQVGLSPKVMARVMRFRRAVDLMTRGVPSWVDLAVACGYYDQAHLNREFRALAGCTPVELLAGQDRGDLS